MTASTEQERAEFEAWYIAGARKSVPAFAEWSEIELREGCMRPDSGSYRIDYARIAWDAWQAARRAPAVTDTRARYSGSIQELKQYASEDVDAMVHICNKHIGNVPKGFFLAMQECAALVGRAPAAPVPQETCVICGSDEPYTGTCGSNDPRALCKKPAPQPPEADHIPDAGKMVAAPVQLPEPVAVAFRFETEENGPTETGFYPSHRIGMGWTALYTEQQVRDLLAAHGIGKDKA